MAGYSTPAWVNGAAPAINASNLLALGQAAELAQHPYGVCSTAAATAAKTVTLDYSGTLSLFTGLTVRVKFSNSNTASSPTLNVNGTGAKAIKSYGTTAATTWIAGQVIEFVYDGTNWLFDGIDAYTKGQSLSAATASAVNALTGTTPTTPNEALSALTNVVSHRLATGSYTGTGTRGESNPTSLTFDFAPQAIAIVCNTLYGQVAGTFLVRGQTMSCGIGYDDTGSPFYMHITWDGNTVSWWANDETKQLNAANTTYRYIAWG